MVEPGVYLIAASMPSIRPLKKSIPLIKNIQFTYFISNIFNRSSRSMSRRTWPSIKTEKVGGVVRSTNFELKSRMSHDGSTSMHSTSRINPPYRNFHENEIYTASQEVI